MVVAEDASTSIGEDMHKFSIEKVLPRIARVRSTAEIIGALGFATLGTGVEAARGAESALTRQYRIDREPARSAPATTTVAPRPSSSARGCIT